MDNVHSLDAARKNKKIAKANDAIIADTRKILNDASITYLGPEDKAARAGKKDASKADCDDPSCCCCGPETACQDDSFRITITLDPPESFWKKENYGRVSASIGFDTIEEASEAYCKLIKDEDCPEGFTLKDIFEMQRNFLDRQ